MTSERTDGDGFPHRAIEVRDLSYRYRRDDSHAVLNGIDLDISSRDYLLITGRSGSGKSTLCRTFNGLIPHFYGGVLSGEVRVAGRAVCQTAMGDLFSQVAMVFQNPDAQLFCRTVEQEIVFGLERLGLPRKSIADRLEAALDHASIDGLRRRDPQTLSGGEKQLVLIMALMALRPRMLILDEPFANLDPAHVRRIRALLRRLHGEGVGMVVCEHRLSRAVPDATRVVVIHQGRVAADAAPAAVLANPAADWGLEAPLAIRAAAAMGLPPGRWTLADVAARGPQPDLLDRLAPRPPVVVIDHKAAPVLVVEGVSHRRGDRMLLDDIGFTLQRGECMAIVGANGAGKTTLLRHLMGLQRPTRGAIRIHGEDVRKMPVDALARRVGLAFQNPDNQFFKFSVDAELRVGPEVLGILDNRWIEELMAIFHLDSLRDKTPFHLSGGEKKRVAFAAALAARPAILALDEPTAGQDFRFRKNLRGLLARMQEGGQAIILVTHDLTFAERVTNRWLVMAGGRLLADDAPDRIMADAILMAKAGLEPTERFQLIKQLQGNEPHA